MEKLGEIYDKMEEGIGRMVKLCGFLSLWNKVVGERVGKNANAVKIKNGTLYISTSSPAWANELTYFKDDIISKYNVLAGYELVKEVKIRSGGKG